MAINDSIERWDHGESNRDDDLGSGLSEVEQMLREPAVAAQYFAMYPKRLRACQARLAPRRSSPHRYAAALWSIALAIGAIVFRSRNFVFTCATLLLLGLSFAFWLSSKHLIAAEHQERDLLAAKLSNESSEVSALMRVGDELNDALDALTVRVDAIEQRMNREKAQAAAALTITSSGLHAINEHLASIQQGTAKFQQDSLSRTAKFARVLESLKQKNDLLTISMPVGAIVESALPLDELAPGVWLVADGRAVPVGSEYAKALAKHDPPVKNLPDLRKLPPKEERQTFATAAPMLGCPQLPGIHVAQTMALQLSSAEGKISTSANDPNASTPDHLEIRSYIRVN